MGKYIEPRDLEAALTARTVAALFDDDRDGKPDEGAIESVISRAEGWVDSFLENAFTLPIKDSNDRLVKVAALEFAIALSFERHPEYVRGFGKDERQTRFNGALALVQRIADGAQQLPDQSSVKKAGVIGGLSVDGANRLITASPDGTSNAGDF